MRIWLPPVLASAMLRFGLAAYFLWLQVPPLYDEADHLARARAWAAWSAHPLQRDRLSDAIGGWAWPPLHSVVLALGAPFGGERFVAASLGALTTALVFLLARELCPRPGQAALAAWAHALYPTAVFFGVTLWPETLLTALGLGAAVAALRARPWPLGLLLGLAAVVKVSALASLLAVPAWMAWRRKPGAAVVLVVGLSAASPWYAGAAWRAGAPLGRLAAGDVVLGNHACVRPGTGSAVGDLTALACLDASQDRTVTLDGAFRRVVERALVYWGPDMFPVRHVVLGMIPASPAWTAAIWALTWIGWALVLGSGMAGLWARRRDAELIVVLVGAATAAPLVSVSQPRFHHPSLVLLIPLAALVWTDRRSLPAGTSLVGVLAVLLGLLSAPALVRVHLAPSTVHADWLARAARPFGADVVPLHRAPYLPPDPFPPDEGRAADVVLVSIDTMRADALTEQNSPFLHALAGSGVHFRSAWAPSSWTLPSHVSLWTGRSPLRHGVVAQDQRLDDHTPVLPEIAREAGYHTAAVVSVHFLSSRYGFDRGFDDYEDFGLEAPKTPTTSEVVGERVADRAIGWIRDTTAGEPLFLFLHFFDAHTHYDPPLPFGAMLDPPPLRGDVRFVRYSYHAEHPPTEDEMSHQVNQYHEAIRYVDHQLSRVDRALRERGRPIRWVVVADHGEEFGERGSWGHVHTLHRELTQVPMVVAGSSVRPRSVEAPVALLDVMPTLAAWFGHLLPEVDGVDLNPVLAGLDPVEPRVLVAEVDRMDAHRLSWMSEPYRLEWDLPTDRRWLYDHRLSPDERVPIHDPGLEASILEDLRKRVGTARESTPPRVEVALEPLEALGYVEP